MNLEARKISFIQEFLKLQNEEIISSLESFLKRKKTEQTEKDFTPMSSEQYYAEIDQAMDDSKNDRIIDIDTLKSKIEKWN